MSGETSLSWIYWTPWKYIIPTTIFASSQMHTIFWAKSEFLEMRGKDRTRIRRLQADNQNEIFNWNVMFEQFWNKSGKSIRNVCINITQNDNIAMENGKVRHFKFISLFEGRKEFVPYERPKLRYNDIPIHCRIWSIVTVENIRNLNRNHKGCFGFIKNWDVLYKKCMAILTSNYWKLVWARPLWIKATIGKDLNNQRN